MTSEHSYRVGVAAAAVDAARTRSSVADLAQRQVLAGAIALMRAEGLSDRKIATELGISKSSIRAMSAEPTVDPADRSDVARLAHQVWVDVADLAGERFVVEGDDIPSFERMAAHGIEPAFPASLGHADTTSREYVQMTTGERILVFSQSRWSGFPDQSVESGWDHRGSYLVHRCPGLEPGVCAESHTVIRPADLGLDDGVEIYGSGWIDRKPTAHQVWKLLTAAIEECFEVFDPSYPELELRRRPGTTLRYPIRAGRRDAATEVGRTPQS
ncbi:hypothetical protein OG921_21460 [Aldersonia sp. NBC_00410]|uniref:hypothetical protein n=1 Tax=Aldersonia sp. NBC_00410 TaxID=2975954 RepID=UPI002252470F|nr:hypothetical protein [Aldersonia sp. NBC_00410]MCX5045738.1 hypothetical protein [Aldersonia sp. NBC_00410]